MIPHTRTENKFWSEKVFTFIIVNQQLCIIMKAMDKNNNFPSQVFLGQLLSAQIDRPMGSKHPDWGFIYPLNYGFVPDYIAPDGEALDAYVLGIFEPIETFRGVCIAIIHRLNDIEDKLVLAPPNKTYTNQQIMALVEFQERFFDTRIISNE